ncbi:MAG: hypothetical protein JNK04_12795 [Myxococcales bacterium]|nr:hypothetical protein [Myxococcales bacterium]
MNEQRWSAARVGAALRLMMGTLFAVAVGCAPTESGETEQLEEEVGEAQDAIQSNPTQGGPYGNYTTYRCTAISTAYCYNQFNVTGTTQTQINTYLNNARRNWGCGTATDPRGYVTSGRFTGSQWQWYYGAGGYYYGCVAWWNSEKQAAYILIVDPTSAANVGTSPDLYWKWEETVWHAGPLGMPISNPITYGWTGATAQWFSDGLMTQHPSFGAHYATNDLAQEYRSFYGMTSPTAWGNTFYPLTGDQQPTIDNNSNTTGQTMTYFDTTWGYRGYVVRKTGAARAFTVQGPIARAWDVAERGSVPEGDGWQQMYHLPFTRGNLGFPTSNLDPYTREVTSNTPLYQQMFENGVITWQPTDSFLNGTRPRPVQNCSAGSYDVANGCVHLNGIQTPGCSGPSPSCAKYGTRYSNYMTASYVTANLPFCSSLDLRYEGYWRRCRDGEGNLSNAGAHPSYPRTSYSACQLMCPDVTDGGFGGDWDTPCFNANAEYSQCGEYGEYEDSCTSECMSNVGGFHAPALGNADYENPCTKRDGTQTTCGAMGLAIDPVVNPNPPPPECHDVCSPVVACSGTTCLNDSGTTTTCQAYTALPCGRVSSFQETADGPRFQFRISSPLVAGPGCGGDDDGDCLDNTMEDQLAMAAAPRMFYDEEEACGGGPNSGGYNEVSSMSSLAEKKQHCDRVDLFQVRPVGNAQAFPWYATGNHAGAVSSWADDGTVKTVVIRYLMAYPLQGGFAKHVGDLEWIEVGLQSSDLQTWVVKNIWLSHHGPVDRGTREVTLGPLTPYAKRMAVIAKQGTGEAILNIATDEDSHGSWGVYAVNSQDCDALVDDEPGGVRDCFISGSFAFNYSLGRYSFFDASRNIGGSYAPEYPRIGGFPGPAQLTLTPNWMLPDGDYHQSLYNLTYDSGHGIVEEAIIDTCKPLPGENNEDFKDRCEAEVGIDWRKHQRFGGWKCAQRTTDGNCMTAPDGSGETKTDGNCYDFSVETSVFDYQISKPAAMSLPNEQGYCYTLWGAQSRRAFVK